MVRPPVASRVVFALSSVAFLHAQTERASIIGTITDQVGRRNGGSGRYCHERVHEHQRRVVTDNAGAYTAVNLIPGQLSDHRFPQRLPPGGVPKLRSAGGAERAPRHDDGSRSGGADGRGHRRHSAAANGKRLGRSGDQQAQR